MEPPFASVVIPTYNRCSTLGQVLRALLDQSYPRYEVIVVDDGSSDSTEALLRGLADGQRLRYYRQEHRGPAAARNRGIREAQGEMVAFIDDDCLAPEDWLERLLDGYRRHPQVAGVGGRLMAPREILAQNLFAQLEHYETTVEYRAGEEEYLGGFECPAGGTNNLSYKRAILEEVGGFDESFPVAAGEDADLKWRICARGHQLLYLPLTVLHLDPYDWRGFLRRSFRRGRGRTHFERKYGQNAGPLIVLLRLVRRCLAFFPDLVRLRPRRLAALKLAAAVWVCLGQWAELRRAG